MWTIYHIHTFLLTFISYALFHATRKTFSNIKSTISEEWSGTDGNITCPNKTINVWISHHHMFDKPGDAETYLGVLDAVFMVSYAIGLYISGILGDRFELRKVLSIGMCLTGLVVIVFGPVLEWSHYYNKYLYVVIWSLNGLLQSSGWPTVVAVMGNWFGKSSEVSQEESRVAASSMEDLVDDLGVAALPDASPATNRGFVLGLWSACASVGNIIGALMVSQVLKYGYEYAFLVTASTLFAGGVINFFGLVNTPEDIGLPATDAVTDEDGEVEIRVNNRRSYNPSDIEDDDAEDDDNDDDDTGPLLTEIRPDRENVPQQQEEALSFWKALCLPGVLLYALAYFCLKLINYSFFFWLPYYLHESFGWSESTADKISIWYDIGGIVGGTIAGVVSDWFQLRSVVVVPMLLLSIPSLLGYSNSPNDLTQNAVLMTITGYFIGGVANLISAAISADLGKQDAIQGNKQALATVTGIVDGTGSVGAALGQILVPLLQEHLGWHSVFYLFIVMTVLTILCILPMFIREVPIFISQFRTCARKYKYNWYCGVHLKHWRARDETINSDIEEHVIDDAHTD